MSLVGALVCIWLLSTSHCISGGWGLPSVRWDEVVPSAVEFRPDGGKTTEGLRPGFYEAATM